MNVPSVGLGWGTLVTKVDKLVKDFAKKHNVPGMTVAITKNDRLILSKGYGYSNVSKKIAMEPFMRIRIGSVTKAVCTGPAGWKAMKSKGIDPKKTTLYGPKGIFKNRFKDDILKGIALHNPEQDWMKWYKDITIQHLMDHTSGFNGSGDEPAAAAMFNVSQSKLTYEHVHRHFLRTRKLLAPPGKKGDYSNHGFGLWTLIIPEITGKSYTDYVRDNYLKPLGLHVDVVPESLNPDSRDAVNYSIDSKGKWVSIGLKPAGLGAAAGGYRASAQDLVRIMVHLDDTYSYDEIDAMGWGENTNGRLEHGGLRGAGTARVMMFPKGHELENKNVSRVNVAVNTNLRLVNEEGEGSSAVLIPLMKAIALAVPNSDVPKGYALTRFMRRDSDIGGEFKEVSSDGPLVALSNSDGNLKVISYSVNDRGKLSRSDAMDAGAAAQVKIVQYDGENAAVALRDLDNNFRLIAMRVSDNGKITRKGDVVAGPIKSVALTKFPVGNGVITATHGTDNSIKLIAWEVNNAHNFVRRGDVETGPVKRISIATTLADFDGVVTATAGLDDKLKLIAWKFNKESKTFSRKGDVVAGEINGELTIVRARVKGKDIVVTGFLDGDNNLKLITWLVTSTGEIDRKDSITAGKVSLVDLAEAKDGQVVCSVKDGAKKLRMLAFDVNDKGRIERVGTGITGDVSELSTSVVRRKGREFLLTAVRDSDKKLRVISWEID